MGTVKGVSAVLKREIRQTVLMLAATGVTNALAYGYSVLMGRMLTPADYGVVVALQAIVAIIGVSSNVTQTLVAESVSSSRWEANPVDEPSALMTNLRTVLSLTVALFIGLLCVHRLLGRALRIQDTAAVIVAIATIVPTSLRAAVAGIFQGLQDFGRLAFLQISIHGLQLLLGGILVALGLRTLGAVAALPLAATAISILSLGVFRPFIADAFELSQPGDASQAVRRYVSRILGFAAITMLLQVDMIMVKRYFLPDVAGQYAAAFTLGKIIFFLPVGITAVMFPKVSHRATEGRDARRLLWLSLLGVVLPCSLLSAIYFRWPQVVVQVVLGSAYSVSGKVLGTIGLAMTLRALLNVWLYYYMALRRARFVWLLVAGTLFLFAALLLFHATLIQVLVLTCGVSLALNVGGLILLRMAEGGQRCV